LEPLPGSSSQYKDRGNRCEGLYVANFGAKSLALVSFTLGVIKYPLQQGATLRVAPANSNDTVHVRAVAKPPNVAYEMDAILQPGSWLDWPVNDVLLPEGLNDKKIGVYGWKQDRGHQVFVPIRVLVSGSPPASSSSPLLTLRPSFDVQVLKWRSAVGGDTCGTPGSWRDGLTAPVDAGQTLDIPLEQLRGPVCLDIAAQGSDSEWVPLLEPDPATGERGPLRLSLP
jgi:hypothetical protein